MDSTAQINAFIAHVKKLTGKFTESRSSLRNLLVFLRIPANSKKRFISEQDIKNRCANPRDSRLAKYGPAIKELMRVWGTTLDYGQKTAPVIPPPATVSGNPATLVSEVRAELEKCRKYACNDVGTFPQCINPAVSKGEYQRIRHPDVKPVGPPIQSPDRSWKTTSLKVAYGAVNRNQAAECTNYAYYAGHLLGTGKATPKPRIEIVSWEGVGTAKHLFVMVGRKGETLKDGMVPPVSQWNSDLIIVDCWALTLGWECVYTKDNYCFKDTMMYPLKVQMDSTIKSTGLPMNVQGGLNKTGFDLTR